MSDSVESAMNAKRAALVANLRDLADALADERMPLPWGMYLSVYTSDASEVHGAFAAAPGNWSKAIRPNAVDYKRQFGADTPYGTQVQYELVLTLGDKCKRVQTGTRHVEAQPARDEPIYEWDCTGSPDPA